MRHPRQNRDPHLPGDYHFPGIGFYLLTAIAALLVFMRLPNIPGPFSDPQQYPGLTGFIIVEDIAGIILIFAVVLGLNALWTLYRKLRARPAIRHARYVRPYIPRKGDWELPQNWRN